MAATPPDIGDLLGTIEPHAVIRGVAIVAPDRFIQRYEPAIYAEAKRRERSASQRQIGTFFFMCAIGFGVIAFVVGLILRLQNLSGI